MLTDKVGWEGHRYSNIFIHTFDLTDFLNEFRYFIYCYFLFIYLFFFFGGGGGSEKNDYSMGDMKISVNIFVWFVCLVLNDAATLVGH